MMPTAEGMSHTRIPSHVLRVGQTICLESAQETVSPPPGSSQVGSELDISLDHLNQLILELDPTFEPIQVNKGLACISPPSDDNDVSHCVLVSRGCSPGSPSHSIPIPSRSSRSGRTNGVLGPSGSPTCFLSPLPCGSAPRRIPSPKQDTGFSLSTRLSHSDRNSAISLHSMSTCSDTSYILGSSLSLASEDADAPESIFTSTGSFNDVSTVRPENPLLMRHEHLQDMSSRGAQSSPASLSGSLTDIPVLLVNGAPEPDLWSQATHGPEEDLLQILTHSKPSSPHSFQARFTGSQPSMKFVMDTSKFWFRPHISRAEAEALVKDKDAGTFVIRDSTSYRGSFGLAMKVEQNSTVPTASASPEKPYPESSPDGVRHFLIESSSKGVRIKGSSHEPYFGSLSALVYQHTISAYALPRLLLLHKHEAAEEKANEKTAASEDKTKTASNFIYLSAVPTEMLTGPCAVQKAVSCTFDKTPGSFTPTIVNMKASPKGVTLTDIKRKLFFRRHYPVHLLSYSGEDPDSRLWVNGTTFGARMFGFVAKGVESGTENICHVFAEYDPLQPPGAVVEVIQAAIAQL